MPRRVRPLVLSSTAVTAVVALAIPALATPALANTPGAPAPAVHRASGTPDHVIVLLRNSQAAAGETAVTPDRMAARSGAIRADQGPVRSQISALGGHTTRSYQTVNAVAATVPSGGVAALRANPAVAAVVPDLPIARPSLPAETGAADAAVATSPTTSPTTSPASGARYCPSSASKPQLNPEALELTHTDSDVRGARTARSLGYTGAGVKVGFIADGIDVDQPDLIRANGQHVVVDYKDFSGDGTDAPSPGGEGMGDVSSIAAQGRTSYDISTFVNAAHPLPTGCTIRIEGMAPGSTVVSMKVFANNLETAPTSTIVQAIDYAVTHDHVNVLNESFGSNPYPDNATDPISLANQAAIDSGVTVVASTGDAGSGNTMGTAATDPNVIGAGASTSERAYAQTGNYAFPLSNGKYTSNQASALSSSGISQTNRVMDLLAPGDLNWALCSNKLLGGKPQYSDCTDYTSTSGNPSNVQVFGGTSEAAPLTAGAAALVIQAYRDGHHGATPRPAVVRSILDSSADDLGLPASEQGAGLLNTYRAVQLARNWNVAHPSGSEVSLDTTQASNLANAGSHVRNTFTLTNRGTGVQRVSATVRQVSHVIGRQVQSVPFDAASLPVFYDALGRARPYTRKTFRVPVGTDRLEASVSTTGDGTSYVRATLLDPQGTYTAYTLPQGTGNYGNVDVHQPAPGTWTAIVWSTSAAASVKGPITLRTTYDKASSAGTVSPSSAVLRPGQAQRFNVTTTVPSNEATASSVVFHHRFGEVTTATVVNRAVQKVTFGRPATFSGTFDQVNGRSFSPGQTYTYFVNVPRGAKDLDVNLAIAGKPFNQLVAHLSGPDGEPVATGENNLPGSATVAGPTYHGLQLVHANPMPGRYQLTVELVNQSSGAALPQYFHGSFVLDGARVSGTMPNGSTVSKTRGSTRTVHITNTGTTPQQYFIDARSANSTSYRLVATDLGGDKPSTANPYSRTVSMPLSSDNVVPAWFVPTQVSRFTVGSSASNPIAFDVMPLDNPTAINAPNNPDIEATVSGRSATATHQAAEVGTSQWAAFPSPYGPQPEAGMHATSATFRAVVRARAFNTDVTAATGDPLLATVEANVPTAKPITLAPGKSATIVVHFSPTSAVGTRHSGTVFVDIAQPFGPQGFSSLVEEVAALPYQYTVGK